MAGTVRVGFLGCGTVGSAAVRILLEHRDVLRERAGADIEIASVAVRDIKRSRSLALEAGLLTDDPRAVVKDPHIDIVVEVMGGLDPARDLVLDALTEGKHVVTANKELLATHGQELIETAADHRVDLLFEGAVAGGIPIIRPLKESLSGDRVKRVMGILNGTTNFILTRMSEQGESLDEALREATRLGYAEADPTADIEGSDAAAKLAILASIAFGARVVASDVRREGITTVRQRDVAAARDLGYAIKLLAVAELQGTEVALSVHPAMIPVTHPLAAVRDVFNAVFVEAEESGDLMFLGRGAGGAPTGAAVVSDIVEIARHVGAGVPIPTTAPTVEPARIRDQDRALVRYYIVLSVADEPGVLASVAGVFGSNRVSIASVRQEGFGDAATLVLITHTASEGQHRATFAELQGLEVVKSLDSTMQVHGTSEGP